MTMKGAISKVNPMKTKYVQSLPVHNCRLTRIIPALIIAILIPSLATANPQTISVGKLKVVVGPWSHGVSIEYDGLEVSKGSNMVVTTPPWSPHYYLGPDKAAVESAVITEIKDGKQLTMTHKGQNDSFVGKETITVTEAGRVERRFSGEFLKDEGEALIQWQMASINPTLITGRPYTAYLKDGTKKTGVVPMVAKHADIEPSTLAKEFKTIEFQSRIGLIRLTIETNRHTNCYDYRKNRWSTPDNPFFWAGDLGSKFAKGDSLNYRIIFELPSSGTKTPSADPIEGTANITERREAQTFPVYAEPVVIPRPKESEYYRGSCDITVWLKNFAKAVAKYDRDVPEAHLALRNYQNFLENDFSSTTANLSNDVPQLTLAKAKEVWNLPVGGYALDITIHEIRIEAAEAQGFLYAVQTLKQLTSVSPSGQILVRAGKIRDWPSLAFRGIHLFTGGKGVELHEKLLHRVIGALKLNHIVLQSEYIEWESHPEIHHLEYGMPKDEVRKILKTCADLGIEVIPLVMSLGHSQWIFETGHNLDLAEDPDAKWTYCVTNPRTYEFIYEIYQEALDLFKPKYFHIGHDEFHHVGRIPYRESSKPYTAEELFMMDTIRHYEWLKERNVRMMMWGDILLAKEEGPDACHAATLAKAKETRKQIPKDVVIADWHYIDATPDKYKNLKAFRDDGFETLACTWDRPGNITNFAKAAWKNESWGFLQTTWAGYSLDPARFEAALHQYSAYVLAAEVAWNADNPPNPQTYPFDSYFFDIMGMSALNPENHKGWTANLSKQYNYSLTATNPEGWFQMGHDFDLSAVPGGLQNLKGLLFQLGDPAGKSAIVLRSKLTGDLKLPEKVVVGLNRKADRLAILHTTNFPTKKGAVSGRYIVNYNDRSTENIDVVYGRNILAYDDHAALPDAPAVWRGMSPGGKPTTLRVLLWDNPNPDKTIGSLIFKTADGAVSPIILGVTGLEF